MSLLNYDDIQSALNIDLTDPNGQALASSLIAAAVAYVEAAARYRLEQAAGQIAYFDGESAGMWLPTGAPVITVAVANYNPSTSAYDQIDSQYVRHSSNQVYVVYPLPQGFQSVRVTYTAGWTAATLPADLKQALIDLVGIKFQEVTNYSSNPDDPTGDDSGATSGALKKVSSGAYTEENSSTGREVTCKAKTAQLSRTIGDALLVGVQEVIDRYRVPFAI